MDGGKCSEEVACFHFCSDLRMVDQNCPELCEELGCFGVLRERLLGFYIVAIHVSVSICMVEKIWSGLIIAV